MSRSSLLGRRWVGPALAVAVILGAAGCGDFQLAEFTRATTTTVEVEPAPDDIDDPAIEEEQTPSTVEICPVRYVVAEGESLSHVATRCGVPVAAIMEANGILDASSIRAGEQIVIPDPNAPVPPPWQQNEDGPGIGR
ncbi:LysM peptidoglycan-binding domain-containing protein [Actinomarinicola tropica]|uniref:LysM peptidoglycan-binding domain-containing protein n=1 Tax=Actinomarinicola tropica TaxID=2789776 RepID=A0A5Q2RHM1_9ACTN|nr:LysM domain-containing protein [Actinomarinicola tropica]QGG96348.1 LysM peptidoglycan-binding domain-containing protein [Actinomarinicola tropica]